MKRLITVFIAVGLMASLASCGSSSAEEEAKQWAINYAVDLIDEVFEVLEIETYSPTEFVTCWLDRTKDISPNGDEPNFWQQSKANILNPDYVSTQTADEDKQITESAIECLGDNMTGAEYSRLETSGFIDGLREG